MSAEMCRPNLNLAFSFVVLATYSASVVAQERRFEKTEYKSPDGSLVATVTYASPSRESEILVRTSSGKIVAHQSYRSEDGKHGFGVEKAQWVPDSQFFVFSLGNSGGHQPWHSPIEYFSRKSGQFASLDHALNDAVMNPQFMVEAPDRITVELYFAKKKSTVSLSSLGKKSGSTK